MAACARGLKTASAVKCSAIDPCSGCSAWTVTSGSGAASFLQPVAASNARRPAKLKDRRKPREVRPSRKESVFFVGSIIGSHGPRESLQVCQRGLVANAAVFARILRSHVSILCIDNFQHRGLAALVAQLGQVQRLGGSVGACVERSQLIAGSL